MKKINIFNLFLESIPLFSRYPKLIFYALLSVLFTCITIVFGLYSAFKLTGTLTDKLCGWLGVESWSWILEVLAYSSVSIGVVFFIYFTFIGLVSVISIPFMDLLSAEIESKLAPHNEDASFWVSMKRGMGSTFVVMFRTLLVMFVSLPLLLIPFVGTIIFFCINSWYMAHGYLDYPMGRRGWSFKKKKEFLKDYNKEQLVFGTVIYGLSLVPLANLIIIPWATAASTLFFIKIETNNKLLENETQKIGEIENENS